MPSATEQVPEKKMSNDLPASGSEGPDDFKPQPPRIESGGFFHIYKSGQGYWTRMGTAGGAALIGILSANFINSGLRGLIPAFDKHRGVALACAIGFLAAFGVFVFWLTNRPRNADFLIDTDSEMRKVNWTSKKELLGSTRVVIFSMFLIAFLLFAVDIEFGQTFYYFRILESPPVSFSIGAEDLKPSQIVASSVYDPSTKVKLVEARHTVGDAIGAIQAAGIKAVDIVPSGLVWGICHAVGVGVLAVLFFIFRPKEKSLMRAPIRSTRR